jgi:hypothetical protein
MQSRYTGGLLSLIPSTAPMGWSAVRNSKSQRIGSRLSSFRLSIVIWGELLLASRRRRRRARPQPYGVFGDSAVAASICHSLKVPESGVLNLKELRSMTLWSKESHMLSAPLRHLASRGPALLM